MKEQARNLAVGVTVIVALALLGGMILLFTGLPQIFQGGYEVRIAADATHDAHVGDTIYLAGMQVGRVIDIYFSDPANPAEGVIFEARIDGEVSLPPNATLLFLTRGIVGSAYLQIEGRGEPQQDPATGRPFAHFPQDGSVMMPSEHIGSGMIPKELTDSLEGLGKLADNLNSLIAPQTQPSTGPATGPATAPIEVGGLRGVVSKLNRTLDSIEAVMGDEENQRNIKQSLANLNDATASAKDAMAELKLFAADARGVTAGADELVDKLIDDADRMGELLTTLNRAAMKIESGDGSAGRLLNDPDLYNNLVDASRQLSLLMIDLRQLIEEWKTQGVNLKLK